MPGAKAPWSGAESLWQVQWGTIGFALGSGVLDTTSLTNYSLTTLNASMGYDFYIRSICSPGDTSYWNGPLSFNTLIQGPVGITCTSGGNAGLIYLDDLESQGAWTGNFGTGIRHRTKFIFLVILIILPWLPKFSLKKKQYKLKN